MRWPPWGPDYVAMLLAARADEHALRTQMAEIEAQLQERVAVCTATGALAAAQADGARLASEIEELERALKEAVALGPLRQQLEAARADGGDLTKEIDRLEGMLAKALAQCRRRAAEQRKTPQQQIAAAETPPPAASAAPDEPVPTRRPSQPSCPGIRPPEEAPDVAIVLDASGSMRIPASMVAEDIQREMRRVGGIIGVFGSILAGTGSSRLDEAKKGVNNVVRSLPDDVDVGLSVLKSCPRADNLGFFTSAQRGRLYALVNALQPTGGTPLAQGLEEAGGMVDGVKAPAVMVVISDGQDSCGGDPCATARLLKARKPQLTINVVDIIGNGAASCMASETGGKVLTPDDGLKFEKTIRQATEQVLKPANCP
jgi:Mg-chelatase subunit ChlD